MRGPRVLLVAVAVVAVVAAAATYLGTRDDKDVTVASSASAGGPGWHALPDPPLDARDAPGFAAGSAGVLLVGGDRYDAASNRTATYADAALFATTSKKWSPAPGLPVPLSAVTASAAGDGFVVIGVPCSSRDEQDESCSPGGYVSFAWDGSSPAWVPVVVPPDLQPPPERIATPPGVETFTVDGNAVAFFSGSSQLARYDAGAASWTDLPRPPQRIDAVCGTASQVVALHTRYRIGDQTFDDDSQALPAQGEATTGANVGGAFVEPTLTFLDLGSATWSAESPVAPSTSASEYQLECADTSVLLVGDNGASREEFVLFDQGTWHSLPKAPAAVDLPVANVKALGGQFLLWTASSKLGLAADVHSGAWRVIASGPDVGNAAGAFGGTLFGYVGTASWSGQPRFFSYVPSNGSAPDAEFPGSRRPQR